MYKLSDIIDIKNDLLWSQFDLIIIDDNIKDINNTLLTTSLNAPLTPKLIITSDPILKSQIHDLGIVGYIEEPFDKNAFISRLIEIEGYQKSEMKMA